MLSSYAFINNGIVTNIIVCDNPSEDLLNSFKETYEVELVLEAGKNAVVGGTYDGKKFWHPQPYPSWTKNQESNEWDAPVAYPHIDDGTAKSYRWNEESLSWE